MFPQEITTTRVWIRHQLPLSAPPPPDGDRKLRQKIKSQHKNETEEEISKLVQKERARLNLKWCFDEYFGCPITRPTLGQIVTANVFGDVHLGYIVDITHSSIILVSVATFTVLPAVTPEDIYSAEHSPFLANYLHVQRIYHPQHILDWWSNLKYNSQRQDATVYSSIDILSSICPDKSCDWPLGTETWFTHDVLPQRQYIKTFSTNISSPICTDIPSDWPVGTETWFIHNVLPQRSEFIKCHADAMLCIPINNMTESDEQHQNSLPNLSSVQVSIPDPVITQGPRLLHSNQCLDKQPLLFASQVFTSSFVRQLGKSILFSILLICLITAMCRPIKYHVESFPLTLDLETIHGSLFIYYLHAQLLGCSLVLCDITNRDWFRALAVP